MRIGILTVTPESCTLMFTQGIKLFVMKAPKHSSPKSKRAARNDTPGVTDFAARCALMSYLMHPTRAPSLLNPKTLGKFIDMFDNGTVIEKQLGKSLIQEPNRKASGKGAGRGGTCGWVAGSGMQIR